MKVYESLAFAHALRCGKVLFRNEEVQILESAIRDDAAELARLREALTPSGSTKAAYIAEFSFSVSDGVDEDGNEIIRRVIVPWDTIKDIMAAIRKRASGEKE